MPEVAVPVAKMPSRSHHSAPKFDSKPASLSPFLDEVEQLAESCGLSNKQTIEWAVRYAPNDEKELWQMQEAVGTDDWEQFKKEIFELYPGSTGERKYSIANLQTLIEKQALVNIEDSDDFGTYRRTFLTVATYLKKKARLTDREISIYFLQGLALAFREKVQAQLKAENPKHHSDDPYSLSEISTAALFVLSCDHAGAPRGEASPNPVKKETFDLSKGYGSLNISAIAEEVAKRINTLERHQVTGGPSLPRLRSHHCIFCSDPEHYLSSCPCCAEYIQKGLCQKNSDGQIVLPNGNRIGREVPGRNLKERIDSWHKNKPVPQVSSNFVGAAAVQGDCAGPDNRNDEEMSKREQDELQILENLVASTQKKIDNAKKKYGGNKKENEGLNTRAKAYPSSENKAPANPQTIEKSARPDPQFRYVTPIEDPAIVKRLVQQSLDSSITISTRELLSVAPDVRRQVKDQLVTKRVATTAFIEEGDAEIALNMNETSEPQVLLTNTGADNLIVAKHTEELRVIDIMIQGIKVVATVDDGSQIISIRQDMWEKIGLPIRSDKIMIMESANKTKDETMGLLQDLKINIGGYDFYLQVQVVKDAPYEMLLGRPFFTLTQATHKHFDNGESRLTLFDPNTGDKITFPTRARNRDSKQDFH
jgi:gag-polyprotein putative aspartyl protease